MDEFDDAVVMAEFDDFDDAFTPSRAKERPRDWIDEWSWRNWMQISEFQRNAIVSVIEENIPELMRLSWSQQLEEGMSIGSDDPWFHMGVGMAVRNLCRGVLPDQLLPQWVDPEVGDAPYPDRGVRNWDDYYGGALQAVAGRTE